MAAMNSFVELRIRGGASSMADDMAWAHTRAVTGGVQSRWRTPLDLTVSTLAHLCPIQSLCSRLCPEAKRQCFAEPVRQYLSQGRAASVDIVTLGRSACGHACILLAATLTEAPCKSQLPWGFRFSS